MRDGERDLSFGLMEEESYDALFVSELRRRESVCVRERERGEGRG